MDQKVFKRLLLPCAAEAAEAGGKSEVFYERASIKHRTYVLDEREPTALSTVRSIHDCLFANAGHSIINFNY